MATIACVVVEVLTFEGCPHAELAIALAQRIVQETGVDADVQVLNVAAADTTRHRFLGSPSIRVDCCDVEPAADQRRDYAHCCRLYTAGGRRGGLPDEKWIRDAVTACGSSSG
jgi:hypothetical protein